MTHLYPIPNSNALYLYTNEHQILLRARTNEGMTRPTLLVNDYAAGLCDTLFQGTVYFAYLSLDNRLIVKSAQTNSSFYELSFTESTVPKSSSLQLCTFGEHLLLFYLLQEADTNASSLHLDFPFNPEKNDIFYNTPVVMPQDTQWKNACEKAENELQSLKETLAQSQAETAHYQKLLESAAIQYNDLMNVAEKYRDEAIKWRNKFVIRE